jgi:hypothetical protein
MSGAVGGSAAVTTVQGSPLYPVLALAAITALGILLQLWWSKHLQCRWDALGMAVHAALHDAAMVIPRKTAAGGAVPWRQESSHQDGQEEANVQPGASQLPAEEEEEEKPERNMLAGQPGTSSACQQDASHSTALHDGAGSWAGEAEGSQQHVEHATAQPPDQSSQPQPEAQAAAAPTAAAAEQEPPTPHLNNRRMQMLQQVRC